MLETVPAGTIGDDDHALTDGHRLARGAAANALVLIAANFRGVFTFLIARLLGDVAFGRFGLVWATTDLLSKVGILGLDLGIVPAIATRAAAGDGDGARRLFRRGLAAATAASLALALVSIPFINWLARVGGLDAFAGGGAIMLLALPGIAVARISTGASRALLSMRSEFYSRGLVETWVQTGVFVLAVALSVGGRAPALAVVAGETAGGIVAYILAARALNRLGRGRSPVEGGNPAATASTRAMIRFSAPIAGSSLLNVLVLQLDVLLLGAYVGSVTGVTVASFGIFCAAAEVAGGMRKVRQVFDPIFTPVIATRRAAQGPASLRETVAGPGRWVLSAQLPLVGALFLSSGFVLSIYGPSFRQGALWLAILGIAHGANSFAGLVETLIMIERPGLNLLNAAVTIATQLVVGIVLIPRMGVTGAAVAMCAGFVVQGALRFAEVKHVFGWSWPWQSLRRPLAAFTIAFVPALGVRLLSGGLGALTAEVASGALFLGLYIAMWRVLGAEPADREIWRALTNR